MSWFILYIHKIYSYTYCHVRIEIIILCSHQYAEKMNNLLLSTINILILLSSSSSLLHITTYNVYTVTPDDHYYPNTTCHHCHNLQHYLLNITRYFASNTQLLFLPGLHHLHTHLIIQNVHNISLIGSTANGTTLDTVIIQCKSSVGIVMTNITNLTVKNMVIRNCMTNSSQVGTKVFKDDMLCVIFLFSCFKVHIQYAEMYNTELKIGLLAYNILGSFTLSKIKSKGMRIVYTDDYMNTSTKIEQVILIVNQFELIATKTESQREVEKKDVFDYNETYVDYPSCTSYYDYEDYDNDIDNSKIRMVSKMPSDFGVKLDIFQTSYSVSAVISNSTFENLNNDEYDLDSHMHFLDIELNSCNNSFQNTIHIQDSNFTCNRLSSTISFVSIFSLPCTTAIAKADVIKILNCNFINNTIIKANTDIKSSTLAVYAKIYISGCLFHDIFIPGQDLLSIKYITLFIENSKFEFIVTKYIIQLFNVELTLIGTVVFSNMKTLKFINTNKDITFYDYIQYSNVTASNLISGTAQTKINLMDSAYVNIIENDFNGPLFELQGSEVYSYPLCRFQYYKEQINGKGKLNPNKNPLILIGSSNKLNSEIFNDDVGNINCKWNSKSLYYGLNPLKIYEHSIQLGFTDYDFDTGLLCHCLNGTPPNCFTNILGPLYPGQNLRFCLALNSKVTKQSSVPITVEIYDKDYAHSLCIVKSLTEAEQMVNKYCTELTYNIFSESQPQCVLILYNIEYKFPTIFYVQLLKCPAGFSLDNVTKTCDCDQKLKLYSITDNCNINDQTILRPANSWISATTHNNSFTYHVSLHCPFHYCLPHSSHLNFSTPNSQCQFNRSGLLCGHCQQGLSTVFSSYYCQHCSNFYIWLIIPIAVAGLIMVLLLFYLNLTVSDGSINAFVLYTNIISINIPVFFSSINNFTPAYTFISLANLDLGIQTCFYNGMDDYAKMWLQLAFPFYLIFIATLIIITSRYSTTIQRLTARRALPVLATLFLLSYTKILRIVSSVLFFYSTITHLPSKHTTLVWSVDASVPVLGVKFTILFIFCIVLFCMLIPFNIILVFTKTLSRFNLVNKFTPLIDAYRGPYEYELYYWTGFQLLIRSVFFGISALSRNINLTLGIVLISVIIGTHGILWPYKSAAQNVQELLYLFNLQALYTISLYGQDTTNITAVNVLIIIAAVQFSIVFIYHMITYMCDGAIKTKIPLSVNTLIRFVLKRSQDQHHELGDLRYIIPEVTYNYQEFREPLICQD